MKRRRVFVVVPVIVSAVVLAGFLVSHFIFSGNFGPNVSYLQPKSLNKTMAKERAETKPSKTDLAQRVQKLQIPFIANEGQVDDQIKFYAKTFGGTVFVTKDGEIVYSLPGSRPEDASSQLKVGSSECRGELRSPNGCTMQNTENRFRLSCILHHESNIPYCTNCLLSGIDKHTGQDTQGVAIKETLVGGRVQEITGNEKAVTKVSYFKGNDPSQWKSNVSTYDIVLLGEVYDGIELKLKAYGNNVEKLFCVKPDANPEQIQVKLSGVKDLRVNDEGQLVAETELGPVKFTKPVAYQEIDGRRVEVDVKYNVESLELKDENTRCEIRNSKQNQESKTPDFQPTTINCQLSTDNGQLSTSNSQLAYGFTVASYDRTKDLIIDPLLASTFLGGSGNDYGNSLALDTSGNVYVTGQTNSTDFPTTIGAYDTSYGGTYDVFIARLNSDLTTLSASTYLGGTGNDSGFSIALDASGNVYVMGWTESTDFPTTSSAYDTSYGGGDYDVFVSRLNSDLTILSASTYLGGANKEYGSSIALDAGGYVYVTGYTISTDFPTTIGAYDTSYGSGWDAFVSRLNSDLTTLSASTYLGGSDNDSGISIAWDSSGYVYVTGETLSTDFPTTSSAYDTSFGGGTYDAFVSRLNSDLTTLSASTYLGGANEDYGKSIALGAGGHVYVTGFTTSTDFPTTSGAYDTSFGGGTYDAFVSRLNSDLTTLSASTYLGGAGVEVGISIALDSSGYVYVTGETESTDFPTSSAYDTSFGGGTYDAFISRLNSDLTILSASTYLGGAGVEVGNSIALDASGHVYVTGETGSTDFPTTQGAYDTSHNGSSSGFVAKFDSNFSAADTTPPTVSATNPSHNATEVDVNTTITATFSEVMDASTINTTTFTLCDSSNNISGAVSYIGTTATFTPSGNLAYSTTYTAKITTGAKDMGENPLISDCLWTFTTVSDPNTPPGGAVDSYTKLLIHGDSIGDATGKTVTANGNAAVANAGKTVTANGNAQIDTAQGKFGGASGLFDGTGDYLSVPDSDDWNFGSGDFTVDFWVRWNILPTTGQFQAFFSQEDPGETAFYLGLDNNGGTMKLYFSSHKTVGYFDLYSCALSLSTGTWYHIAIIRNGDNYVLYLDGVNVGTMTSNGTLFDEPGTFNIGAYDNGVGGIRFGLNGWLDELRVTKGIARWTSDFTPPTEAYTSDNCTKLLLHLNGSAGSTSFTDSSRDHFKGKAIAFDGSGDYLSIPDSDDWNLGTGDFTIDFWVYLNSFADGQIYSLVTQQSQSDYANWMFNIARISPTDQLISFQSRTGSVVYQADLITHVSIPVSTWVHLAVSRYGNTVYGFINGVLCGSDAVLDAGNIPDIQQPLYVGMRQDGAYPLNGYIDELRISKGIARWTSDFCPPNAPYGEEDTPPTVSSTSPASNATGVAVNSAISATFSEDMDSSTINTSTFTLSGSGGSNISGTVSFGCCSKTATFTPSSNLDYSTTYTVTITTGVKDTSGNAMTSDFTWGFTTGEDQQPVANAGDDQTVNEDELVSLQGSGTAPQGVTLTYQWTQVAGPSVTLSDPYSATPTFTAPEADANVTLTFQLVVSYELLRCFTDNYTSDPDTIDVTIVNVNHAPVAYTGDDQAVAEGTLVTLHGESSYDQDGSEITYQWTQVSGPTVTLSDSNSATPTFTAPSVATATLLEFELVVDDGELSSEPAVGKVTVENVNHAPVADTTGSTQTVDEETQVTLDGSQSYDPDGDSITYQWTQVSGTTVTLSDPNSANPSFTAPQVTETTYLEFELVVSEGQLSSGSVSATVTVLDTNQPIDCTSATPSTATLWPPNHKLVSVSIEGVTDPDNEQVTITITGVTQDEPVDGLGDGDTSPDAVIQGDTVLLRAERSGTSDGRVYEVHFTADDGQGSTCEGSVRVSVPHDKKKTENATDSGQNYDSTQ